jgi:transcriptional regulator with XRE-family HTH domain
MGQRIRVLRESRHMSLSDLATTSGVTKAYLVGVENDRKANLTLKTINKIAVALGAQPSWVAYGVVPASASGDQDALVQGRPSSAASGRAFPPTPS